MDSCVASAILDQALGTTRSEDNADSWANLIFIRTLVLAYPEYDFSGPVVRKRKTLLHHFLGFVCLRHPDEQVIESLEGYISAMDLWKKNSHVEQPPTFKELLDVLAAMYNQYGKSIDEIVEELVVKPFEGQVETKYAQGHAVNNKAVKTGSRKYDKANP